MFYGISLKQEWTNHFKLQSLGLVSFSSVLLQPSNICSILVPGNSQTAHIFDFSHFIFSLFHKVPVLPSPRPLPPSSEIGKAATLAVVEAGSLLPRVLAAFSMGSLQCLCRELGRSTLHVFSHKQ